MSSQDSSKTKRPSHPSISINRKNSIEEKRRMRNNRKKRRRVHIRQAKLDTLTQTDDLKKEQERSNEIRKEAVLYEKMAKNFWERWQWELLKHKEALEQLVQTPQSEYQLLHEIDHCALTDPIIQGESVELFVGRGFFQ